MLQNKATDAEEEEERDMFGREGVKRTEKRRRRFNECLEIVQIEYSDIYISIFYRHPQ